MAELINYAEHRNIMLKKICILFGISLALIFILCILPPVDANEVYGIANNKTVIWNWSDSNVDEITVDGVIVEGFKSNSTSYQQTFDNDVYPTAHKLITYTNDIATGNNVTMVSFQEPSTLILDTIWTYLLLMIIVSLIVVGYKYNMQEMGLIGFLLSVVGVALNQDNGIAQIIYAILIMICIGVTFTIKD